jgi:hypothetical protein
MLTSQNECYFLVKISWRMESVLSIDCGIKNLGASLWENGKLKKWWLI